MIERRRLKPKVVRPARPFRYRGPFRYREIRAGGRRALLRALAAEYKHGNSLSRLYVALLARTMVEQEPKLLAEETLQTVLACGVKATDGARRLVN
jgi:hypothetical protein